MSYLPKCTCATKRQDDLCPVHALGARRRQRNRALMAVRRGHLSRALYDAWLRRYPRPKVSPYGAISKKVYGCQENQRTCEDG